MLQSLDLDCDRRNARFPDPLREALTADDRRLVVVGARGWIGRTLLDLLYEALGPAAFRRRVCAFGSVAAEIDLSDDFRLTQAPLSHLGALASRPTLLFHLAFLTKDKVAGMDAEDYARANRALSAQVEGALDRIGVDRLFVASSGAAAFADDPGAAADLRLYGALKREDEVRFSAWALAEAATRRAAIGRIYSVSGPWMNKHETYALASFILDGLARRPIEVRAPIRVFRSYVAVREVLGVVLAALLSADGEPALAFSTGGEALELGEVAAAAARMFGFEAVRRPTGDGPDNVYVGDNTAWSRLLVRYGLAHLPLEAQIAETAAWLARETGGPGRCGLA